MERRLEVAAVRRMMAAVGISVAVFVGWAGTVDAQTTTTEVTGVTTTTLAGATTTTADDTGALPATGGGLLAGASAGAGFPGPLDDHPPLRTAVGATAAATRRS